MGRHKALLDFAGVPLIVATTRLLKALVRRVRVVGSPERYIPLGLDAIADQICGRDESQRGPLAGIASALAAAETPWNLILACDLPYLSTDWVEWLLAKAPECRAQVVMPRSAHGDEPLAALYRRDCAGVIEAALQRGICQVSEALGNLEVELIPASQWRSVDPDGRVLTNMNTPQDYAEAQKWWEAKRRRVLIGR